MVSLFDPKKPKTTGTTKFLSGIARSRTSQNVDLADHESSVKKIWDTYHKDQEAN
jgi:hypothetical protein